MVLLVVVVVVVLPLPLLLLCQTAGSTLNPDLQVLTQHTEMSIASSGRFTTYK